MATAESTTAARIYVYILEYARPPLRGPHYYAGQTSCVLRRLVQHFLGSASMRTAQYGVKRLVAVRGFATRAAAKQYEWEVQRALTVGWVPPEQDCSFVLPANIVALQHRSPLIAKWVRDSLYTKRKGLRATKWTGFQRGVL
jgi:predicted GIY-YIG superfamily endonuclease